MVTKSTNELEPKDFSQHAVWEYVDWESHLVQPVEQIPVKSMVRRIVGTKLTLHNGREMWGVLTNIHLNDVRKSEHFLALWLESDNKWFQLARYHDVRRERLGPEKLAEFLKLPVEEIFPISYDIRGVAIGLPEVLQGKIQIEPREKLSRAELIQLSLED